MFGLRRKPPSLDRAVAEAIEVACSMADTFLNLASDGHTLTPGELDAAYGFALSTTTDRMRTAIIEQGNSPENAELFTKPFEAKVGAALRTHLGKKIPLEHTMTSGAA